MNAIPEKASFSQIDKIVALNRLFHLPMNNFIWDTPAWVEEEVRQGHYYILQDERGLTGAMCLHMDRQSCKAAIETIAVRQSLHGQGIGRRLIEYAKDICAAEGITDLAVDSFCDYGLTGFYGKCGFACTGTAFYEGREYYSFSMPVGAPQPAATPVALRPPAP